VAVVASAACAAPVPGGSSTQRGAAPSDGPGAKKRITAAFLSDPPSVNNRINVSGGRTAFGVSHLEDMLNTGVVVATERGKLQPRLVEAVPTVENGLWKVFPDGRMETTLVIKQGAQWHDGTPLTPRDLAFTARITADSELPFTRTPGYDLIEQVEAVDARTARVSWKQPFIDADAIFEGRVLSPRHILEEPYLQDKPGFTSLPYWTTEYVGVGPFKLREFVRGSHLVLDAFDGYVLGRPKIDEIEVLFRPDANTLAANILAGAVDLTIGQNLTLESALDVGAQWRNGTLDTPRGAAGNPIHIFPQLLNPTPAIIGNVDFRRAAVHALDRGEMIDSLMAGRAIIAHGVLWDGYDREYADIESGIVRYELDLQRASRLMEGLGYRKGPDGMYRDGADERLSVELRTLTSFDTGVKVIFPIADYWQRAGIGVETLVVPQQRTSDQEYRATRPGFEVVRSPRNLARHHSLATPLPETSFRGENRSRYMNVEFDALIDRYFLTIPWQERMSVLRQVVHHMTDQVTVVGLFFDVPVALVSNRLVNVHGGGREGTEVYNVHEWDVK